MTSYQQLHGCQAADIPVDRVAGLTRGTAFPEHRTNGERAARQGCITPGKLDLPERTHHDRAMQFEILGDISDIETFATGAGIREIARLRRIYGRGRWRKRKGIARVRLSDGSIHAAELHWYEATGTGRKEIKIKHLL